jgi:hypothetical protein
MGDIQFRNSGASKTRRTAGLSHGTGKISVTGVTFVPVCQQDWRAATP